MKFKRVLFYEENSATVNPRISPLGAYLFLMLFGWGLILGGLIRGGAYKII